jgi:hypothetical protein
MAKMETTVVIGRPVHEVFAFFLALDETAPKTDPTVHEVIRTPTGPVGPGTTFRFRQQNLGKMRETTTRFTSIEPNQKIGFEAEIGPMRPICTLSFEPTDAGTRVTFRGDSNPPGLLRVLEGIMNRKGQQAWTARLARIKTVLESSPPVPAP